MPVRKAEAEWNGNLTEGTGRMKMATGAYEGPFSFKSRMENGTGTNPEELLAAAHAGCFSMAFSAALGKEGFTPTRIRTSAAVHFNKSDGGFAITRIELDTEAQVPGIDLDRFQALAQAAKSGCPVSKALAGTDIHLNAKLLT